MRVWEAIATGMNGVFVPLGPLGLGTGLSAAELAWHEDSRGARMARARAAHVGQRRRCGGREGIRAAPPRSAPRGRAERGPTHARAPRPPAARASRRGMGWHGRRHGRAESNWNLS
jgi:hypothetical protein